jgi:hypothetical protein
MSTKESWPELVGQSGEDAKKKILAERPDLQKVEVMLDGSPCTMDYRVDRVRIFTSPDGKVTGPPMIG